MKTNSLGRAWLLGLTVLLAGCAEPGATSSQPRQAYTTAEMLAGSARATSITVDGDTADWQGDAPMGADPEYLYIRFSVDKQQYTLQSAPVTTCIELDLDGDVKTGERSAFAPFDKMGVDLEVEFSPMVGAARKNGVTIAAVDAAGNRTPMSIGDVDFASAPTYASSWYEMRISRTPENAGLWPRSGLLSQGTVRGVIMVKDTSGRIKGYSDPFECQVTPAIASRRLATVDLPPRPDGAVRVMSYNVEKSGPMAKAEVFRRVFQAIRPDVVLMQEWESGDAASVQSWFTAMVGGDVAWNVVKAPGDNSTGGGVVIVSRFPLAELPNDALATPGKGPNSPPHHVRFVGATVSTSVGDFLVGSTHLKCCGSKDSPEDLTRMAEARAVNEFLAGVLKNTPVGTVRVLSGDLNLVGSRPPLDLLRAGLDSDMTDLTIASPMVLGDRSFTTWRDPQTGFGPGRLDYMMYSDANADVVGSFVLDTARLSDAALARIGLDRTDCEASDHLPVVVDLRPRR